MKCSDLQSSLPLYSDGHLSGQENALIEEHLSACPVCRQSRAEMLELQASLRQLRRPDALPKMRQSLKYAIARERRRDATAWFKVAPDVREWLQMRLMPYAVGVLGSLVIGATFFALLPSAAREGSSLMARSRQGPIMLATNQNPFSDEALFLRPEDYARTRISIAAESPSLNPRGALVGPHGALVALANSFARGQMEDGEVVVLADVFGNGLAQITEVVESSHDQRAVLELQKALDSDPSYAPFVPASMDNRSENVKVVLRFQSVNVSTSGPAGRR